MNSSIIPLNKLTDVERVDLNQFTFNLLDIPGRFTASRRMDGWTVRLRIVYTHPNGVVVPWHDSDVEPDAMELWQELHNEANRREAHRRAEASIILSRMRS